MTTFMRTLDKPDIEGNTYLCTTECKEKNSWETNFGCTIGVTRNVKVSQWLQLLLTPEGEMEGELWHATRVDSTLVIYTPLSLCCQSGPTRACPESTAEASSGLSLANNSRQLMCQCRWGPVQDPETASLLPMVPQHVLEVSVVTTTYLNTCYKGTPAHRNARSDQGLNRLRQIGVMVTWCVSQCHAHLRTRV